MLVVDKWNTVEEVSTIIHPAPILHPGNPPARHYPTGLQMHPIQC